MGTRWKILVPAVVIALVALIAGGLYWRSRSAVPASKAALLTEKDTVVLADFDNTTGDVVFDGAMKQALAVQLGQSPFINILSDRKVGETLRLMGRQPGTRITQDIARELCVRTGSKAIVLGSISNLGGQYVIGVDAVGDRRRRRSCDWKMAINAQYARGREHTHLKTNPPTCQALALRRKSRANLFGIIEPWQRAFIPMGGPQAHVKLKTPLPGQ